MPIVPSWGGADANIGFDLDTCTISLHKEGHDNVTISPVTGIQGVSLDIDIDDIECDTLTASGAIAGASVAASGALSGAALNTAGAWINDDTPAIGGSMSLRPVDSGIVPLVTDGAVTAIPLAIPAGSSIHSVAIKVTTAIAGVDSTTGTLALTGGNTETLLPLSDLTAGSKLTSMAPGNLNLTTQGTTNASFTLSGGDDNTPSAGAVRVKLWCWTMEPLD